MANARITLRAAFGTPLDDPAVRDMVVANAEAIAERQGVPVVAVHADPDAVTIEIRGTDIEAMGLAAELRRATNRWHERKYGAPLWGT